MRSMVSNWRKLIAVFIFGTVALATSGASGLLSATDRVDGHVVAAVDNYVIEARIVADKPLDVSGLFPGDAFDGGVIDLYNNNGMDGPAQKQYMYVENLVSDVDYCDYVYLTLAWDDNNDAPGGLHPLWEGALTDLVGEANKVQVNRDDTPGGALPGGWTTRLVQAGWIDAESEVIGDSCTWDEVFIGEQFVPVP